MNYLGSNIPNTLERSAVISELPHRQLFEAILILLAQLPQSQLHGNAEEVVETEAQISASNRVGLQDVLSNLEAQDDLSDENSPQDSGQESPEQHFGWLPFVVGFILGRNNQSDPIWRLRLLSSFCLAMSVMSLMVSALLLPKDLCEAPVTYQRVIFIANFGAPVAIAAGSLVLSFWMTLNPTEWGNWPTGLSVANARITGGGLILYLVRLYRN